jgi:hypothetical protein
VILVSEEQGPWFDLSWEAALVRNGRFAEVAVGMREEGGVCLLWWHLQIPPPSQCPGKDFQSFVL